MKASRRTAVARSLVSSEFIEQLESRQMLAATLANGVLSVVGSNHADKISVTRSGANIVVKFGNKGKNFAAAQVSSINIRARNGDDRVSVNKNIANVSIDGGTGDDTLLGGGGGDIISGGAGDDEIKGRGGDDQIYGEDGDDNLSGGAGDDTIGGDNDDVLTFVGGTSPAAQVGRDTLNGGAGDDWLLSGVESDVITDPSGADQFTGGSGRDILDARGRQTTGQMFETATADGDTITDFENGTDFVPVNDVATDFPANGTETDYSQHRHAFLKINIIDDNNVSHAVLIPAKAGEFDGAPVVHTHDTGVDVRGTELHFHNTPNSGGPTRIMTLGDFFEHWGISFSSQNIGRFRVDANHKLTMTVKTPAGGPNNNTQFNKYVIQNASNDFESTHFDQIVITYGPK